MTYVIAEGVVTDELKLLPWLDIREERLRDRGGSPLAVSDVCCG